jgi:sarcosine oxidase subunit beta
VSEFLARGGAAAADVIIVGGGIMGASAALFLRRRGRSVILLERGLVGQQASGVNFGNVRRQGRPLFQLPLANRSRELWGRLPELVGEDCEFTPSGHARVFYTPEFAANGEAYARDAAAYGLHLELLSGNALRARFPYVSRDVLMASFGPHDGHANPRLAAPAFARAARRSGAQVEENTEVLAIEKVGGDFHVETKDRGRFRAPALLVTAGAWAGSLAAAFGEPVPLTARGPQMGVTEPVPYFIEPCLGVSTSVEVDAIYLRQIPRGNIIFGGGLRPAADIAASRAHVDPQNTLNQIPRLQRLVPSLGSVRLIRSWSGVEAYLPDDLPVIGASGRVPGLYYAFGFSGGGFQLGPGVGDVMAELIDTGTTTTPIEAYDIRRFVPADAT